jgi:predicted GNAT family N-acyltransferase
MTRSRSRVLTSCPVDERERGAGSVIDVRLVPYAGGAWLATVELRREILRRPLGLDFDADALARENTDLHLAAYASGELVGCLVLTPHDAATIQMRQVAVRTARQRLGIGKRLVAVSEREARERGYQTMMLHARETAVPFYERLAYAVISEPYLEVGVPHRTMEKSLVTR